MQVRNHDASQQIQLCVGIVCRKNDEVLLIKRAQEPQQGQWSIPGGRVNFGETLMSAAKRELAEETAVNAEIEEMIGHFEFIGNDYHYVVFDYFAKWVSGSPIANDDALEARFFPAREALTCVLSQDLRHLIAKVFGI